MTLPRSAGELVVSWRDRAAEFRRYGPEAQAVTLERAAQELEGANSALSDQLLTLSEAAARCGRTPDHLGRLIRQGRIPNAGRAHAPRIRAGDLPVAGAGGNGAKLRETQYDANADARALGSRR